MIPTLGPSPIASAVNLAPMLLLLDGLLSLTKYTEAAECARWFGASLPLISATANCNTAKKTAKKTLQSHHSFTLQCFYWMKGGFLP